MNSRASAWRWHVIASSKFSILPNCWKRMDIAYARLSREDGRSGCPWGRRARAWRWYVIDSSKSSILPDCWKRVVMAEAKLLRKAGRWGSPMGQRFNPSREQVIDSSRYSIPPSCSKRSWSTVERSSSNWHRESRRHEGHLRSFRRYFSILLS